MDDDVGCCFCPHLRRDKMESYMLLIWRGLRVQNQAWRDLRELVVSSPFEVRGAETCQGLPEMAGTGAHKCHRELSKCSSDRTQTLCNVKFSQTCESNSLTSCDVAHHRLGR